MPDLLVCSAAVVLQDVVLLCARCHDELLGDGLRGRGISVSLVDGLLLCDRVSLGVRGGIPESLSGGHRGCRSASRRGSWGLRAKDTRDEVSV